jgi:hypothetical protein
VGNYEYEIVSQDSFGSPFKRIVQFSVQDINKNLFPEVRVIHNVLTKTFGKKNELSKIVLASTQHTWVLVEKAQGLDDLKQYWVELKNGQTVINHKHTDIKYGRTSYQFSTYFENKYYDQQQYIYTSNIAPEPNNTLKVSLATFKNNVHSITLQALHHL